MLADTGMDAVFSYAGRTDAPVAQPLPTRIGGFGGVEGLVRFLRSEGITGLSIAVVDGPRVVWAHGAGWADANTRQPATPDTVYRMGSITKLFTATATMRLAEAGRIDPDAPFTDALPARRRNPQQGKQQWWTGMDWCVPTRCW